MKGARAIWLRYTTQPEAPLAYLKLDQIVQLEAKLAEIGPKYDRLLLTFTHRSFKTELAAEYARHGYMRRAGILKRCIENVFALIPPSTDEVPERDVLQDATINVQSFLANAYGSIDNLAWLWLYERGLESKIAKTRVGFRAKLQANQMTVGNVRMSSMLPAASQPKRSSGALPWLHIVALDLMAAT